MYCAKIYENIDSSFIEAFEGELDPVYSGDASWSDYDNDGDLDIMLSGFIENSSSEETTSLFHNTGNGFVKVNDGNFPYVYGGKLEWGDFDNDGDLDLFMSGVTEFGEIAKFYKNEDLIFEEVYQGYLPNISIWDAEWGDVDNDGDLDLAISGDGYSRILENTGTGFIESQNYSFSGLSYSDMEWGDYDNDGDLDLIMSGGYSFQATRLYENNGNGFNFINLEDIGGLYAGALDWGDLDNDGDLDLLISGTDENDNLNTKIYQNEDGFTEVYAGDLIDLMYSDASWGDYDNDGDLDIVVSGISENSGHITKVYKNTRPEINTPPEPPTELFATQTEGGILFEWNNATDDETPQDALTYNIRVGTAPGGVDIVSPHTDSLFDNRQIVEMGNSSMNTSFILNSLSVGPYFWSVQTIDNGYKASAWSEEKIIIAQGYEVMTTEVPEYAGITYGSGTYIVGSECNLMAQSTNFSGFSHWSINGEIVSTSPGYSFIVENDTELQAHFNTQHFSYVENIYLPECNYGDIEWGDYDGDGDLDILMVKQFGLTVYKNAYGNFTVENPYTLAYTDTPAAIAWNDIDNDNDLDIIFASQSSYAGEYTHIYENVDNSYIETFANQIMDLYDGDMDMGDFDNDGDLDLLIAGRSSIDTLTCIYKNNGDGFSLFSEVDITGITTGSVQWADYDNDGDLDILIAGQSKMNKVCKIYQNNNQLFTEVFQEDLPGISMGTAEWIDYDSDGDLDVFVTGEGISQNISKLFNYAEGAFSEIFIDTFQAVKNSYASWADFDNDGDLDLLLGGDLGSDIFTALYENKGTYFMVYDAGDLPETYRSRGIWADYDNDGDLDILFSSNNVSKVYRNNGLSFNTIPTAPANLESELVNGDIVFTWYPSFDLETNQEGLTYNLRIGSTEGGSQIKSIEANVNSGKQFLVEKGNVYKNNSWILRNATIGHYLWGVQAIDNGFAGSGFSPENLIIIPDTFEVQLFSLPVIGGTTSGEGIFLEGDTCHAIPLPQPGYKFLNWTENDSIVSIDSIYTFVITNNRNLTANFDLLSNYLEITSTDQVYVFPNPFKNKIHIAWNSENEQLLIIRLYDLCLKEQMQWSIKFEMDYIQIQIKDQPEGVYFLTIENEKGNIINVTKLIKID